MEQIYWKLVHRIVFYWICFTLSYFTLEYTISILILKTEDDLKTGDDLYIASKWIIQNFLTFPRYQKQKFWKNLNLNFFTAPPSEGGTKKTKKFEVGPRA